MSVTSRKAKFVEAKLDVSLIIGEELVFEPCTEIFNRHATLQPFNFPAVNRSGLEWAGVG